MDRWKGINRKRVRNKKVTVRSFLNRQDSDSTRFSIIPKLDRWELEQSSLFQRLVSNWLQPEGQELSSLVDSPNGGIVQDKRAQEIS